MFGIKKRSSKIKLSVIIFIGWRNLKANKARSFLTVGGVAIGIGIITFLASLGFGLQFLIIKEVTEKNPINIIDVDNKNLDSFVTLEDDTITKIRSIDGVERVEKQVNTGGQVNFEGAQTDVIIFGANIEYLDLAKVDFKLNDQISFSNESEDVLISNKLAQVLGFSNPVDAVGKKVSYDIVISKEINPKIQEEKTVEGNETIVAGIINDEENIFMLFSFEALKRKFEITSAQQGKIYVGDLEKIDSVRAQMEQMGFVAESIKDIIKEINDFFMIIRIVMIILGVIIMSISAMGMINTLSVSLLQRTKEVGILKALGAKRSDIFKLFIFEAVIISFTGGILGFFGGCCFAKFLNYIITLYADKVGVVTGNFVEVPLFYIVAISVFIFFLAFSTGIMPAYRAAKIHALDALRYE